MDNLEQHIESLIFTSDKPLKISDIIVCLEKLGVDEMDEEYIKNIILQLLDKYRHSEYSFQIVSSGGGYQFLSKKEYNETIAAMLQLNAKRRLTGAAMETLSIIAYKQPVSKSQIEQIRGVNSEYTVHKLMEKELVEVVGREEVPGRPLLYGTTTFFMDYFGINSLDELPRIKEFENSANQIGNLPDIEQLSEN